MSQVISGKSTLAMIFPQGVPILSTPPYKLDVAPAAYSAELRLFSGPLLASAGIDSDVRFRHGRAVVEITEHGNPNWLPTARLIAANTHSVFADWTERSEQRSLYVGGAISWFLARLRQGNIDSGIVTAVSHAYDRNYDRIIDNRGAMIDLTPPKKRAASDGDPGRPGWEGPPESQFSQLRL